MHIPRGERAKGPKILGMPSNSSPVSPDVVRKVAALARLSVPEEDLPVFAQQLARIVSYIDQLKEIPEEALGPPALVPTPLRADEPMPGGGLEALEGNLPRSLHGYGVVPRVVGEGEEPS